MGGTQPRITAAGESGLPDQITEKPWSEYGSKAWPDPNTQYWRQRHDGKGKTTSKLAGLGAELGHILRETGFWGGMGAAEGALMAPPGHRLEGAARDAATWGVPTAAGIAGSLPGQHMMTNEVLRGLKPPAAVGEGLAGAAHAGPNWKKLLAGLAATIGGSGLAGYGGYKGTQKLLGDPSWAKTSAAPFWCKKCKKPCRVCGCCEAAEKQAVDPQQPYRQLGMSSQQKAMGSAAPGYNHNGLFDQPAAQTSAQSNKGWQDNQLHDQMFGAAEPPPQPITPMDPQAYARQQSQGMQGVQQKPMNTGEMARPPKPVAAPSMNTGAMAAPKPAAKPTQMPANFGLQGLMRTPALGKQGSAGTALPARLINKLVPLTGERRQKFSPEEDQDIAKGESQWIEPPLQTDATPISEMLASPGKQGLLASLLTGGLGGAAGYGIGSLLGHPGMGAGIGAGVGALAGFGPAAEHRWRRNEHIKEVMRRLEPGATKRDYTGQQMLTNALESRFGGEEKMSSVLPWAAMAGGALAHSAPMIGGVLGGATAPEGYGVQGALGGAARGAGTALGGAAGVAGGGLLANTMLRNTDFAKSNPRAAALLTLLGAAGGGLAGGWGGHELAGKLVHNPGLDARKKKEQEEKQALDLTNIDSEAIKQHLTEIWGKMSPTQKAMVIGGGAGAGLGMLSVAPQGIRRGLVGGALGVGAGYAAMQPGVRDRVSSVTDQLLHGVSKDASFASPDLSTSNVAEHEQLGRLSLGQHGPQQAKPEADSGAYYARMQHQQNFQGAAEGDTVQQQEHSPPSLENMAVRQPIGEKLGSFAQGFLQSCCEQQMTPAEIVKMAEAASEFDPEVAVELAPLLKEAGPLGAVLEGGAKAVEYAPKALEAGKGIWQGLKGLLGGAGKAVGRVAESGVGEEGMSAIKGLAGEGGIGNYAKMPLEAAKGVMRGGPLSVPEVAEKAHQWGPGILGRMGAGAEAIGKPIASRAGQMIGRGSAGYFTGREADNALGENHAGPNIGMMAGLAGAGSALIPGLDKLMAPVNRLGMRELAGWGTGTVADEAAEAAGIDTGGAGGRWGSRLGLLSSIPGLRRAGGQLGEETFGRVGRMMQQPAYEARLAEGAMHSPSGPMMAGGESDPAMLRAMGGQNWKGPLAEAGKGVEDIPKALGKQIGGGMDWLTNPHQSGMRMVAEGGIGGAAAIANQRFNGLKQNVIETVTNIAGTAGLPTTDAQGNPRSPHELVNDLTNTADGINHLRDRLTPMAKQFGIDPSQYMGPDGKLSMEGSLKVANAAIDKFQKYSEGTPFGGMLDQLMGWFGKQPGIAQMMMIGSIVIPLLGALTGNTGAGLGIGAGLLMGGVLGPQYLPGVFGQPTPDTAAQPQPGAAPAPAPQSPPPGAVPAPPPTPAPQGPPPGMQPQAAPPRPPE